MIEQEISIPPRKSNRLRLTAWTAADKALPMIYGVAVVAIPLHFGLLNTEAFGTWVVFQTLFLSISLTGDFFFLQPMVKLASEFEADQRPIITAGSSLYTLLSLSLGGIVSITALFLADILKAGPTGAEAFALMVATVGATIPRNIAIRVLQVDYRIFRIFLLDLVYFGGFVLCMIYGWQTNTFSRTMDMVWYNLYTLTASSVIGALLCGVKIIPSFKNVVQATRRIVSIGLHQGGTGIMTIIQQNVDVGIVTATRGPLATGVYTAARIFYRIFEALREAGQLLLISATSNAYSRDDKERVQDITVLATATLVAILYPATILLILLAPIGIPLILPKVESASTVFQWLIASGFAMPFIIVPSSVLLGIGETRDLFRGMLIGTIVLVGAGIGLTYEFGPDGMAAGVLLGNTTIAALLTKRMNRYIDFSFRGVLRRSRSLGTIARTRLKEFRFNSDGSSTNS
ncbi:MAG: polysaccharide biosynthesis C-terminal domain-containing protein [Ignavibacteriae bacterium]|nr:polysaccharide biosynthesis C-terminal domain-containing protein [Ignavibacteriota bacterium]MCB9216377.1 polysaccharide biosynthesis C-terminal domain-containing protein [Ignavibacteria bacterium]